MTIDLAEGERKDRPPPKITTEFVHPPIPLRAFDWAAYYADEADEQMSVGHGETEAAAIHDLVTNHPRSGNICGSCKKQFFFGDTCGRGGCPNGGDV